mgnify:CR=1 FL=1
MGSRLIIRNCRISHLLDTLKSDTCVATIKRVQSGEFPEEIWLRTTQDSIFTIFLFPISYGDCQQIEMAGNGKDGPHVLSVVVHHCETPPNHLLRSILKIVYTPLLVVLGYVLSSICDSTKARLEGAIRRKQHFESL